jgi:integrating conjugative element membrane protein (TIGR03747 family)
MSEERRSNRSGFINDFFGLVVNTAFLLFVSLLISVVIEWLGLYFHWWDGGSQHSLDMLRAELMYANDTAKAAITSELGGGWIADFVIQYKSIMHTFFHWCLKSFTFITKDNETLIMYADSGYNISLVYILRVILILFSFPLFLMVFIWGFVDGLVERDLRKFGAGRESSTIFEAARRLSFPLLVLPFVVYLSYPTTINPLYIIPPSAIFQALLYRMLFSKYKKYL